MRGTVQGVVLTLIDIEPLKAAENAVFRERYLLDSLMDSVPDAIYFKDAAGRFVRVNQAMAERLGSIERSAAVAAQRQGFPARGSRARRSRRPTLGSSAARCSPTARSRLAHETGSPPGS